MQKRILIVDDHPAVRRGIRQVCCDQFPMIEFGEAVDFAEVFRKLAENQWDLVILDIDLQGRNGLDILKQMKEEKTKVPVLVFSFHDEAQIAAQAFRTGAAGYLSKDASDTELADAVTQILAGKKYIASNISEKLAVFLDNYTDKAPHELLSEREYQIFRLIVAGKTVTEIAGALFLSKPTVSTYRARLLEKMKLKNNAELMTYAVAQKLI